MSKKLFVGSLSWNTTDEGLRRAFEKFGEVLEAKVIKDRETDRSRGFGFVSFANPKDAMDAMAAMDGQELDGRTIGAGKAGPVTKKLQKAFFDVVTGKDRKHKHWLTPVPMKKGKA